MILDEGHIIGAEGDEDGLLVDGFGFEPEGHFVGPVKHVLVQHIQVGVVLNRSIH